MKRKTQILVYITNQYYDGLTRSIDCISSTITLFFLNIMISYNINHDTSRSMLLKDYYKLYTPPSTKLN